MPIKEPRAIAWYANPYVGTAFGSGHYDWPSRHCRTLAFRGLAHELAAALIYQQRHARDQPPFQKGTRGDGKGPVPDGTSLATPRRTLKEPAKRGGLFFFGHKSALAFFCESFPSAGQFLQSLSVLWLGCRASHPPTFLSVLFVFRDGAHGITQSAAVVIAVSNGPAN